MEKKERGTKQKRQDQRRKIIAHSLEKVVFLKQRSAFSERSSKYLLQLLSFAGKQLRQCINKQG